MEMCLVNPSRTSIDAMRNTAFNITVKGKFDYLLFVDDDSLPPPDSLARLLDCRADIAAADVIIRGYPFDHMCFRYTDEKRNNMRALANYDVGGPQVQAMDAVGFTLCLIKRELIEQVQPPYSITGLNHTEDVYFCLKARAAVPTCSIVVDTKLECGHILWPEVISSTNRDIYKEYFETLHPEVLGLPEGTSLKIDRTGPDLMYEKVVLREMQERGVLV